MLNSEWNDVENIKSRNCDVRMKKQVEQWWYFFQVSVFDDGNTTGWWSSETEFWKRISRPFNMGRICCWYNEKKSWTEPIKKLSEIGGLQRWQDLLFFLLLLVVVVLLLSEKETLWEDAKSIRSTCPGGSQSGHGRRTDLLLPLEWSPPNKKVWRLKWWAERTRTCWTWVFTRSLKDHLISYQSVFWASAWMRSQWNQSNLGDWGFDWGFNQPTMRFSFGYLGHSTICVPQCPTSKWTMFHCSVLFQGGQPHWIAGWAKNFWAICSTIKDNIFLISQKHLGRCSTTPLKIECFNCSKTARITFCFFPKSCWSRKVQVPCPMTPWRTAMLKPKAPP